MPLSPEQSSKYVSDINNKYKGIALTDEKKQEIISDMAKAGVSYDDYSKWVDERQSFPSGEGEMGFATGSGAETRFAGPIESLLIRSKGEDAVSKSIESGVFPQDISKIAYDYGVEPLLNVAQTAASIAYAPEAAAATAARPALNVIKEYALYGGRMATVGAAKDVAESTYKKVFLGQDGIDAKTMAANAFDNFSSSIIPMGSSPIGGGTISKPLISSGIGLGYGGLQGIISSSLRDEGGGDAALRIGLTSGLSALGMGAGALSEQASNARIIERNTNILRDAGIDPELGMVNQDYAHAMMAKADGNIAIGRRLNDKFNSFLDRLQDKVSQVGDKIVGQNKFSSPADLTKKVGELTSALPSAESSALEAGKTVSTAEKALEMAKAGRKEAFKKSSTIVSKKQEDAIKTELQSTLDSFYKEQSADAFKSAIGNSQIDPITAQQSRLVADQQIDLAYKAFTTSADAKFGLVPKNAEFMDGAIRHEIESVLETAPADQKAAILGLFDREVKEGGLENRISMERLLNVKRKLWGSVSKGPSTSEDHFFREAALALGKEMDAQAPTALGVDGLSLYKDANAFYKNIEKFKFPIVKEILWGSNEHTPWAQKLVSDMERNGIGEGTMYKTVLQAADGIEDSTMKEMYRTKIRDAIRSYFFDSATILENTPTADNPRSVTRLVSPKIFADKIKGLSQRPDALKELGFGDSYAVNRFIKLATQDYPDASKITPESLNTLLTITGTKKGTSASSLEALTQAMQDMAIQHANSKMNKAAVYEAIGAIGPSRKAVSDARDALSKAKLNLGTQEEAVAALKNNPIVQVFRNANVDAKSFNDVRKIFFDPTGPLSNSDLKVLMTSLENGYAGKAATRESKMLASALKVSFLNDAIGRASNRSNPAEALRLFASALEYNENKSSLYQRAVTLFGKETVSKIRSDYKAASMLADVVNAGIPDISTAQGVAALGASTAAGVVGKGLPGTSASALARNSVSMIAKGKYALANAIYGFSPELYVKSKSVTGSIGEFLSKLNYAQKVQWAMQNREAVNQLDEENRFGK